MIRVVVLDAVRTLGTSLCSEGFTVYVDRTKGETEAWLLPLFERWRTEAGRDYCLRLPQTSVGDVENELRAPQVLATLEDRGEHYVEQGTEHKTAEETA